VSGIHFTQQQIDHTEQGADAADTDGDTGDSQQRAAFAKAQIGQDFMPECIQNVSAGLVSV
jgi:hypothetical protein